MKKHVNKRNYTGREKQRMTEWKRKQKEKNENRKKGRAR